MASDKGEEPVIAAHQAYLIGDYNTALQHLNKLEAAVGPDHKRVKHNKALVEFMQTNMLDIEKFTNTICEILGVNFPEIDELDVNSPIHLYNYAVLLYHSRYYYQCAVLLEKLLTCTCTNSYKDQKLLQHAVVLLMESTLCRRTADKTLEIAKVHGDIFEGNSELSLLFERLVNRANLMLGNKKKITLKPDRIENLFIISHEQHLNNDAIEAINILSQYKNIKYNYDFKNQGEDIWAALNNNLGVIYLTLRKPFLATKYFQVAVKEHFRVMDSEDGDRLITCKDRPLYIYNLGISLLAANKPEGAFECLVEAARHYPNNPRIWLRLAECCVKKCCSEEAQQYKVKKLGSGPHRRILLAKENAEHYSSSDESFAIPTLSLEFAALCLRNAMSLLQNEEPPADVSTVQIQVPPCPPINWKQRGYLMNSILILQTYVLLNLQDPLAALICANELLKQQDVAQSHKALAHIYAAEALINLDRVSEVNDYLNPKVIHELTANLPAQLRDMIGVSVWAKAAVCNILKGDLVTARNILLQINSPRVLPLQMYLEMCTGNIKNCHVILRELRLTNMSP